MEKEIIKELANQVATHYYINNKVFHIEQALQDFVTTHRKIPTQVIMNKGRLKVSFQNTVLEYYL